jgi:hypothetical protein
MGSFLYVAAFVATGTTAALKGRWWVFFAGLVFFPGLWAIAFFRSATPRSWWFAHVYDDRHRLRALALKRR